MLPVCQKSWRKVQNDVRHNLNVAWSSSCKWYNRFPIISGWSWDDSLRDRVLNLRENQLNKTVNSILAAKLLLEDASSVQPFDLILTHEPHVTCGFAEQASSTPTACVYHWYGWAYRIWQWQISTAACDVIISLQAVIHATCLSSKYDGWLGYRHVFAGMTWALPPRCKYNAVCSLCNRLTRHYFITLLLGPLYFNRFIARLCIAWQWMLHGKL